ncbi:hypothetical protein TI05_01595 [Achromatium sp. WMS3]|nr:hypothetical protein TI05_01595 [Achromatium sp. WMS3]
MTELLVPQAVYTDPMTGGRAGGYYLAARSPGIRPEDAIALDEAPGITPFLQETDNDILDTYFSFFELTYKNKPTGRYALMQRFASGDKMRNANRIVAHSLIFTRKQLDAWAWDVEGIRTSYDFVWPGAAEPVKLPKLRDRVKATQQLTLPDLTIQPNVDHFNPQAVYNKQVYLCKSRQQHGCGWTPEELRDRLIGTLHILHAEPKNWLLLPQEHAYQFFLHLAWLILPPKDRPPIAWTTHLAPDPIAFRLACASQVNCKTQRRGCIHFSQLAKKAKQARPELMDFVTIHLFSLEKDEKDGLDKLKRLRNDIWSYNISLRDKSDKLSRWLIFRTIDAEDFYANGSKDYPELTNVLKILQQSGLDLGTAKPPWIKPDDLLLGIARTGLNIIKNQEISVTKESVNKLLEPVIKAKLQTTLLSQVSQWQNFHKEDNNDIATLLIALYLSSLESNKTPGQVNDSELFAITQKITTNLATEYSALCSFVQQEIAFKILALSKDEKDQILIKDAQQMLTDAINAEPGILQELINHHHAAPNFIQAIYRTQTLWQCAITLKQSQQIQSLLTTSVVPIINEHPDYANNLFKLNEYLTTCSATNLRNYLDQWPEPARYNNVVIALWNRLNTEDQQLLNLLPDELLPLLTNNWKNFSSITVVNQVITKLLGRWKNQHLTYYQQLGCAWWELLATATWDTFPSSDITISEEVPEFVSRQALETHWPTKLAKIKYCPENDLLTETLFRYAQTNHPDLLIKLEKAYYTGVVAKNSAMLQKAVLAWEHRIRAYHKQPSTEEYTIFKQCILKWAEKQPEVIKELRDQAWPITLDDIFREENFNKQLAPQLTKHMQ